MGQFVAEFLPSPSTQRDALITRSFANKYRGAYTANCSLDAAQFYPSKSYNGECWVGYVLHMYSNTTCFIIFAVLY